MGRLTNKNKYGVVYCTNGNCQGDCNVCYTHVTIIRKLAHYEDLEEQGRLIEQKQGYWIKSRKYYDDGYTVIGACSVCGLEFQAKLLRKICYCPHCGAKMKLKELEGDKE